MSREEVADLTAAQREELERRWHAFQQDPEEGESWVDVKAELSADEPPNLSS